MVLFLNKKKLQEQKPLVNNTYQGKYDYSQMQYLPEDQRFGFDTLVEVARDTNKKSLWDIFSKKPKMVFPVGEGMSEEETKKAKEILSKEDLAVKAYREGSFFTRPTAGFYDPMASGFMKDTEIALQTLFSPKSTREEKIESLDFLMQPIISASQPFESAYGKIPTTTPKGKIKSSVLKIFAKEKNPLSIERSLRQIGIDDINAKSLSFDLAKANTADEVGDALVAFSNKPLSIASKNVADDVASGVTKQATSISDDLAKLKPQTDDLLAEARKYKSAEEFVKAQGVTKDYVAEVKPTKLRADDRSVFKTAGEARGNAREITNKEIEIAGRDQKIFDANKDKTIPQLQKEIAESKKWADENSVSYPRSIQVKEEIIKTKSQLTDIWNKAQANIKPATETLKPAVTKGVASISDDLAKLKPQTDDLLAEARKYKSAEEFVKAQGITPKDVNIRLTEGDNIVGLNFIEAKQKGTGIGSKTMDSLKNYADAKGKTLVIGDITNQSFYDKFDWLKKPTGLDTVRVYSPANDVLSSIETRISDIEGKIGTPLERSGKTTSTYNPKTGEIMTTDFGNQLNELETLQKAKTYFLQGKISKSQLTDIWNKAQGSADDLITEAKKYKSAEEFVYHTTPAENIISIQKEGLKAGGGQFGKGTYLTADEETLKNFIRDFDVQLRIKKDVANRFGGLQENQTAYRSSKELMLPDTGMALPAEALEIKTKGGEWIPLKEAKIDDFKDIVNVYRANDLKKWWDTNYNNLSQSDNDFIGKVFYSNGEVGNPSGAKLQLKPSEKARLDKITKSQLTDIWNKAQANIKPATETLKPAVIQGETFTLGTSKTTQPTLKERKLELKATQKEIKNAQIAQEKANKLERKEQKIREEAIANLQRFRGNTENIKADLEKRNLSQEDIDNIILEDGTKLNDAIKVKRNSDGSLSDVITKKEIDDLKASYTDEIPKNKWQKRSVLVDGKEVATNAIQSLELPYSYFERKGLSYIYDQVIKSGRDAELLKNSFIQKFKDNDLFKDGSWFTADRFNIDKKEARAVSEYYLGRQGKTKPVELSSLPEKSQKFIKIFDEIINETTQPFYQMASKMGKEPGVVENYAPLMTSEDIKLIDEGGAQDWLFRKHPAFSALKERVKKAPVEVYEKDYRKVATRWLEGMSQFLEMSETTNHLKYLINSDEFKNIVKDSDYAIISKWLKDITTPKTPDTLIKKTFTPLSQLTRKGVAMGALGLNYATVLKQALTQIPIAIIEKSLPKTSSEYAKAFGINVKDLPSISKRKGDIAIQDLQGKISRIFTGSITKFDKMNAQTALNGLLDKEYNKVLKEGVPITKETQNLIEKNAQDKIDMWFGGFFKGQRPEAYREELGNFILMFTYPLTSQANGFFRHILKAKGFKGNIKAVAEVLAAVVGIAYMEKVIENLSPQWSDEKEMTKDTLVSLSGNLPMVGDIVYSLVNDQDINLSPVIGNVNNIVRAISKGDGEKIFWTLAETVGLPKQVRRVKEGFQIMEDGGITDNNGKMLAPVEGAMEYIRAFLRGKYGPLASQDWIRNVGAKKEDKRWFVPEVEFIQNGDYERKAEIYKTFDRQKKKEFYNMLSEGQQKKLDNALKGITPKSEGRKSLSDIFK